MADLPPARLLAPAWRRVLAFLARPVWASLGNPAHDEHGRRMCWHFHGFCDHCHRDGRG